MDLLVNIDVDDLAKAITFYREAIGMRVARRFGSLGYVISHLRARETRRHQAVNNYRRGAPVSPALDTSAS